MKLILYCLAFLVSLTAHIHELKAGEVADAARSGDIDRLIALLEAGAPVDEPGAAQPLHFACMSGQTEAALILIERGADPNADSALGTPLMVAATREQSEIMELLLANGADASAVGGKDERTALHAAAHTGALEATRILLDHGADPDARTKFGEPALHLAVKRKHTEVADLLRAATKWTPPPSPSDVDLAAIDTQTMRNAIDVCDVCHSIDSLEPRSGPPLLGIYDNPIAGTEGFTYSEALKSTKGVWDVATLNAFLADPKMAIPGNAMGASGDDLRVTDQATRWAIIAFLREQG
ncbi:MAG: ankyrin repeat domain-containing protein [Ruegeria sp.]